MSCAAYAAGVLFVACTVAVASSDMVLDHQRDALSLGGTWQVLLEHGDAEMWKPDVAAGIAGWKNIEMPSNNLLSNETGTPAEMKRLRESTKFVWVRRAIDITETQAARGAVLKWTGIRFGATAWINGKQVAHNVAIGPHTAILPTGTLKAGRNEIVMRVCGWAGVPRSKSAYPLTPTGAATQNWGAKNPGVFNDIWLEFYRDIYAEHVLAMPNLADGSVTFRVKLRPQSPVPAALVTATVREVDGDRDLATHTATTPPGPQVRGADVTCKLPDFKPWTPQTPHLYEATVRVHAGERLCDEVRFTFGMREISIVDGHFRLNGKPLWLRGSNLVNEWFWGDLFNDNLKEYLINEARAMNLNCFRTHTQPPPATWLNMADREGMMILAEFPLLYNHADFRYTPEELEVFHANAIADSQAWITRMWNHPSIVIWVLSNESKHDNAWEAGPYYDQAKTLDPTRPYMRTGEHLVGTPDMTDIHTCFNVVRGAEGQLIVDMTELAARKDPKRPLTNTEYMNRMWDPAGRWLGRDKHPDMPLRYAECATEHTEAMRRLKFDCLLPYMYAGWTRLRGRNWREDYPTPMAAALHSSMAPVLASLDVFDRDYVAGSTFEAPLVLVNETHGAVDAKLDVYITPRDPLFVPDDQALAAAVWHTSQELKFEANSQRTITLNIAVPKEEGSYYLAAVLRREGDKPVVSQRVLRSVKADKHADRMAKHISAFGLTDGVGAMFKQYGCGVTEDPTDGKVTGDVVLIDDATKLTAKRKADLTAPLRAFAEAGGRIVVLQQEDWSWNDLADVKIGLPNFDVRNPVICSRAHRYEGADHAVLRDIPADWLWRWNGLPGEIMNHTILEGPAVEKGQKILWASRAVFTAVLSVPMGKGEIVFCQLRLRDRVDRKSRRYDPVAERVLVNLLSR